MEIIKEGETFISNFFCVSKQLGTMVYENEKLKPSATVILGLRKEISEIIDVELGINLRT